MKRQYVKHRQSEFKVGDGVMLTLQRNGYAVANNKPEKLKEKRTGPYKIVDQVGHLASWPEMKDNLRTGPPAKRRRGKLSRTVRGNLG
jgi:hypothetical protein